MPLLRQKVVTSSFAEVTLKTFWQLAQREGSLFFKNYAKENSGNRIHKYFPFRRSADVLRCASKQTLDLSNNRNWNIIAEVRAKCRYGFSSYTRIQCHQISLCSLLFQTLFLWSKEVTAGHSTNTFFNENLEKPADGKRNTESSNLKR